MIRAFNTNDLNATMDIWLNSNIKAHPFLKQAYFLNRYESFMREQLLENKSFVYEIDGKVVGFVSVDQNMKITAINIAIDYQDKEIGEKLLDYVLNKYQQLQVEFFRDNAKALEFFMDNGFEVIGVNLDDQTQKDLVVMSYELDTSTRS